MTKKLECLQCRCCKTELLELDEIEIHGDMCHECAWGFGNSNQWWQLLKNESKFKFNKNHHLTGCKCSKCLSTSRGTGN